MIKEINSKFHEKYKKLFESGIVCYQSAKTNVMKIFLFLHFKMLRPKIEGFIQITTCSTKIRLVISTKKKLEGSLVSHYIYITFTY